MTFLEAVGDYVQAQGEGTLGTNVFLGRMPDSPDVCVGLFEYSGSLPEMTFGSSGIAIDRPQLQVMCRATRDDYPTARDKAVALRDLLTAVMNTTLGSFSVLRIEASGSVNPVGPDEKDRPLVSVNFNVMVLP